MSTPKTCFIDTSILAGQQYNFSSTIFTSFVTVAKEQGVRLLLPDPTAREISRQIRDRSMEALKALEKAKRQAPFLAKWKHFPKVAHSSIDEWEVQRVANQEWSTFLKQFDVIKLGYDDVNLQTIMNWYDSTRAPFGGGKKRKEFPDAFAVAILVGYASKNSTHVAVVSSDDDFKRACVNYSWLLHFPTLPSLTEQLLTDTVRADAIKQLVEQSTSSLNDAIIEAARELPFYHRSDKYDQIEDIQDLNFEPEEIRVVGIGADQCTITFSGILTYRILLNWWDVHYVRNDYYEEMESSKVSDASTLSGTAKVLLSSDLSEINEILFVELDNESIDVKEEPR